jgi:hypothetical protein
MIAIKGMEMPTSCKECMLNNVDSPWFGLCRTTGNNVIEYKDSRHPDCPLVEIITCKECKYARQSEDNDRYCYLSGKYHDIDYFCADAERRK